MKKVPKPKHPRFPCRHCFEDQCDHVRGQCLLQSTQFSGMSLREFLVQRHARMNKNHKKYEDSFNPMGAARLYFEHENRKKKTMWVLVVDNWQCILKPETKEIPRIQYCVQVQDERWHAT